MERMKRAGYTFSDRYAHKVAPYAAAIRAAGMEPLAVTPENGLGLDSLDALVVCGGTDIDPALYGQAMHAEAEQPDRARDRMEALLLGQAMERDMAVLCICRGLQMLNVARGGSLHQHIEGHRAPGVADAHHVLVSEGTLLASVVGSGEIAVNSRHHQAVDRVGEGLLITARDTTGVVEGLELPGRRFVLGVQWHPEDRIALDGARDLALFQALARAAAQ